MVERVISLISTAASNVTHAYNKCMEIVNTMLTSYRRAHGRINKARMVIKCQIRKFKNPRYKMRNAHRRTSKHASRGCIRLARNRMKKSACYKLGQARNIGQALNTYNSSVTFNKKVMHQVHNL